jgi:hypothetical protein
MSAMVRERCGGTRCTATGKRPARSRPTTGSHPARRSAGAARRGVLPARARCGAGGFVGSASPSRPGRHANFPFPSYGGSPTKRLPSAARSPRLASCGSGPAQNRRTGPLPHVPKNERAPPKRSSFKGLSADPGSAGREGTLPEGLLKVRPGNRCRSGWPGSWQSCR